MDAVAQRAQGVCEYCRVPAAFSSTPFEVDHNKEGELVFLLADAIVRARRYALIDHRPESGTDATGLENSYSRGFQQEIGPAVRCLTNWERGRW